MIHDVIDDLEVGLAVFGTGDLVFGSFLANEVVLFRYSLAAGIVAKCAAADGGGVFELLAGEVLVCLADAGGDECFGVELELVEGTGC